MTLPRPPPRARDLDWYRRLADDLAYQARLRELQDVGAALKRIFRAVQDELLRPIVARPKR